MLICAVQANQHTFTHHISPFQQLVKTQQFRAYIGTGCHAKSAAHLLQKNGEHEDNKIKQYKIL